MRNGSYGIVWMKNVGSRRIIDDNNTVEITTETAQVFNVVPSMEDARLAEETGSKNAPLVK